jgi:peptide/nickel transport system permease protein
MPGGDVVRKVVVRLAELAAVLLLVSFGVFLMVALIPGDPAVAILGQGKPPEQYAALRQELGLDQPVLVRYADWLGGALTGDLGHSIMPPQTPVAERLFAALPVSLELAAMGLAIAVVVAIPLALWSAARQGGLVDRAIGASMFGLLSVPSFLAGLLLTMVFVNELGWFPRAQWVRVSESLTGHLQHPNLTPIEKALTEIAH